jgi:hypothetical protein
MKTELPALIALEAIGQPWFNEGHRSDLQAIALVSQVLAEEESYIHLIGGELLAHLAANKLEVETLRPVVTDILAWLQTQPNGHIQDAIETLLKKDARDAG